MLQKQTSDWPYHLSQGKPLEAHILIQLNTGQNPLIELASYDLLRILIPFSVEGNFGVFLDGISFSM